MYVSHNGSPYDSLIMRSEAFERCDHQHLESRVVRAHAPYLTPRHLDGPAASAASVTFHSQLDGRDGSWLMAHDRIQDPFGSCFPPSVFLCPHLMTSEGFIHLLRFLSPSLPCRGDRLCCSCRYRLVNRHTLAISRGLYWRVVSVDGRAQTTRKPSCDYAKMLERTAPWRALLFQIQRPSLPRITPPSPLFGERSF